MSDSFRSRPAHPGDPGARCDQMRYPEGTPPTNLYRTRLTRLGVPVERIGDGTGTFRELSAA